MQRWLWLILISSVQLIALLAMLVKISGWQHRSVERALRQQSCEEIDFVAQRINKIIDKESKLDLRNCQSDEIAELQFSIASETLDCARFVGLFDFANTNELLTFNRQLFADVNQLFQQQLFSLIDDSPQGDVRQSLSNNGRILSGWQKHDPESEILISARYIPRINAILIVAQDSPPAIPQILGLMQWSSTITFKTILVIGILGIVATSIVVVRVSKSVNSRNSGLEKIVNDSTIELIRTKNAVIFGLAKLAESRDNDTGEHLERIRIYVTILAKELATTRPDFSERFIHDLSLASSLHDIGKVGIPDSILLKPGRLTPEERGIMEIHTLIGGECLDAIQARLGDNEFMSIARQIAYYHHERWDGTGYPHSLKGVEIPLSARIVSVADVYDALTSKRPYKRAMAHAESKEIIVSNSGKHFDPEIVEAFLKHEREFEAVSLDQQFLLDEQATTTFQRLCEAAREESVDLRVAAPPFTSSNA